MDSKAIAKLRNFSGIKLKMHYIFVIELFRVEVIVISIIIIILISLFCIGGVFLMQFNNSTIPQFNKSITTDIAKHKSYTAF